MLQTPNNEITLYTKVYIETETWERKRRTSGFISNALIERMMKARQHSGMQGRTAE